MEQEWWEAHPYGSELYALSADPEQMDATAEALANYGQAPASLEKFFRGGLGLLRKHLQQLETPSREVLRERLLAFAHKERPHLPEPARWERSTTASVWIDPRRAMLKEPGIESFIHYDIEGLVDFAERVAARQGDPHDLWGLFGHIEPEHPNLNLAEWPMPLGSVFRVELNGNHRLAVLAALEVPCVLVEVTHTNDNTYNTDGTTKRSEDVRIGLYRRLLHTYGVAAFPCLGLGNFADVATDWPILISSPETAAESLAAVEAMIGRRWHEPIGDLPRSWFDDPEFLETASRALFAELVKHRDNWPSPDSSERSWWDSRLLERKKRQASRDIKTRFGELPEPKS